ncbi:MAG: protein kinase domain-containing protein, partial [Myxococcaceae bacterium]
MAVGFGKYQLVRKLGTGGMGEVFLARAGDAERRVVVKRILPHLVENEEFLGLFLAEARTAARLNHPNISQIFELGDVEGSWYLTMEYLAGHDLRSVVQTAKAKKKPLPLGAACRIVADGPQR